jgi:hypothetical protein
MAEMEGIEIYLRSYRVFYSICLVLTIVWHSLILSLKTGG